MRTKSRAPRPALVVSDTDSDSGNDKRTGGTADKGADEDLVGDAGTVCTIEVGCGRGGACRWSWWGSCWAWACLPSSSRRRTTAPSASPTACAASPPTPAPLSRPPAPSSDTHQLVRVVPPGPTRPLPLGQRACRLSPCRPRGRPGRSAGLGGRGC
jgi:hypothetical protein